jgi:hypothetical protein
LFLESIKLRKMEQLQAQPMPELPTTETLTERVGSKFDKARQVFQDTFKGVKPWGLFFEKTNYVQPTKTEIFSRVPKNISYFYHNYLVIVFLVTLYCLFQNPAFFIGMSICVSLWYWYKGRTEPLRIGNTEITPIQAYAFLIIASLVLFYFTSGSSTIFWLITLALVLVLGHAICYNPVEQPAPSALNLGGNLAQLSSMLPPL